MTAGELKKELENVPNDALIRIYYKERIKK